MVYDIVIIGAGAAGMTAALYALRNNKTVMIIEQEQIGGQIANSPRVENFPSINSISGLDFANNLYDQVTGHGAETDFSKVEKIEKVDKIFKVTTEYDTFEAKAVIIANGVKHRHTGVKSEEKFIGKGVYYCALCDGPFFEGKEVALIGDANTAFQYALQLSGYCKKVHMYTLFDKYFADKALVDALESRENIEVTRKVMLVDILGEDKIEGFVFKDTYGEDKFTVNYPAIFVAIGQVPDNKKFENVVDLDKQGYIIADESCKTKTEGLFVAGDTRTKTVRQLTTATCDGAVAATAACAYIDTL
ncbi:MAG: FAD-dependent oxidoreductase [Clostridia bacterium]|nr:FAD-dependent oxidoreductase [Clostridia bacterium]